MPSYDVAIRGGKIVDGAGNPGYYADVGVTDGRIAYIGRISESEATRSFIARTSSWVGGRFSNPTTARLICWGDTLDATFIDVP